MALNLALLSDQDTAVEGHAVESRLLELLPVRRQTVCYLPSAPDPNRSWFEPRAQYYARHGLNLSYFGVETEFEAARVGELRSCDAIHLSGGNTFRFMHWLRQRGLDEVLKDYAIAGGVLIGVSAGAIIMTPDLGTAALCGDAPYPDSKSDAGLGLVDFAVLPHFDGNAAHVDALRGYSRSFSGHVYAVPDGSALIVRDGALSYLGPVVKAARGELEPG